MQGQASWLKASFAARKKGVQIFNMLENIKRVDKVYWLGER
jgi:hypothetical protein